MNVDRLTAMLREAKYDPDEIAFLDDRFRNGFDIGYQGPTNRHSESHNLPLKVGSKTQLWKKVMKEVKLDRMAGPFMQIPYENYIQSPVGLVPKKGADQTRMIFHLSFDFKNNKFKNQTEDGNECQSENNSLNHHTPKEICTVYYNDLDHAVRAYLQLKSLSEYPKEAKNLVYGGQTNIKSAFRLIPLKKSCWKWLILKVQDLVSGQWKFFVDKCLPFGASISCAIFQRFSNALKHLIEYKRKSAKDSVTN